MHYVCKKLFISRIINFLFLSPIVGYLMNGLDVEGVTRKDNWLLVRIHRRNVHIQDVKRERAPTYEWGWSIFEEHGHRYFVPHEEKKGLRQKINKIHKIRPVDSKESVPDGKLPKADNNDSTINSSFHRTFSFKPSRETIEWTQCADERGRIYYFNPVTSDSRKVILKALFLT